MLLSGKSCIFVLKNKIMRHLLRQAVIVTAVIFLSLASYAQDIIVTTDARKIEAKITEVSKSEIRYKEADNLDGPTFVLGVEDISTIIYSNGKVVLYNRPAVSDDSKQEEPQAQTPSTPQPVDESLADISLLSGQTIRARIVSLKRDQVIYMIEDHESTLPASQIEKVTFVHNGQVKTYNVIATPAPKKTTAQTSSNTGLPDVQQSGRIYRDNNQYFYNNTYIAKKEVERILERENSAAYHQWKKADGLLIGGAVCTGIGGGLVIGGLLTLATGSYGAAIGMECGAIVPLGIGLGLTLGASSQYSKAIDIYNSRYDHAAIELRWRVSPAEFGLAIAF